MNEKLFKDICDKALEENLSYEEITNLCNSQNIELRELLTFFKNYVEKRSAIEKNYYKSMIENERKLSFFNPILAEKGIYTYCLWETENQHKDMAKYVYGYCQIMGKEIGCKKLSEKYNIQVDILLELHDYYKNILDENVSKTTTISSKYDLFFDILFADINNVKYEELVNIIRENDYTKYRLNYSLLGYVTKNKIDMDYYDNAKLIIDNCFKIISESKKDTNDETIIISKNIIKSFLASSLCLEEFCTENSITTKRMESSITIVKENDIYLYSVFKAAYEIRKEIKENNIRKELIKLYNYLVNGIEINGVFREFTIVDYYVNIKLDYKKLLTYLKLIDNAEIKSLIVRFRNQTVKYTYNINVIGKRMIETEFTMNNKDNVLRTLSLEEKVMILEYLKNNNIPLNEYTIYKAYQLFVNNSLFGRETEEINFNKTC